MPSFSCILYALRVTHRAQVHGQSVHFKQVRGPGLGQRSGSCTHRDWCPGSPRLDPGATLTLGAPRRRRGAW